jgi:large subunit ribosomal protein L6
MSRIGKLPIKVPSTVDVVCNGLHITVKGKFGTLENQVPESLTVNINDSTLIVGLEKETRNTKALHGLYRTLINNMIIGVSEQFTRNLTLNGVGYRANVQGKSIVLNLGYSHPVELEIPEEISVEVIKNTKISLKSCDKEKLGLFAAKIRQYRVPEPYKGKGIIYEGEIVQRKAGKSGKK